jgi:hypothetical protein
VISVTDWEGRRALFRDFADKTEAFASNSPNQPLCSTIVANSAAGRIDPRCYR